MIREIVRDPLFLSRKSKIAAKKDMPIIADLIDTICAHRDCCVGMAANMIGECKRIMVVFSGDVMPIVLVNPVILSQSEPYEAEEGCLCHVGTHKVTRWKKIRVQYQTMTFEKRIMTYAGLDAEIIQHEMDHFEGRLI